MFERPITLPIYCAGSNRKGISMKPSFALRAVWVLLAVGTLGAAGLAQSLPSVSGAANAARSAAATAAGKAGSARSATTSAVREAAKPEPLDLNSASKSQFMKLPGIGEVLSNQIIAARPFRVKNELVQRKILPQATYQVIADLIVVKQIATAAPPRGK